MALDNAANFDKVILSTGYNSSATSVVLTTGGGALLPATPFNLVWWDSTDYPDPSDDPNHEIVRCTNVSTNTLTVTRAQEGTSAANHNTAGKTYKMIAGLTAKVINTDLASTYVALGGALGTPSSIAGFTTAGTAIAPIVAVATTGIQSANVTLLFLLLATPAAGTYRITITEVVTQAATTSSTLPSVSLSYTQRDSGAAISGQALPTNPGNALTTVQTTVVNIEATAGSSISVSTNGYATAGATALQYIVRLVVEFLGG
jgi:hypothetical protein